MLKTAKSRKITTKKTSRADIENFYKGNQEELIGLEYERLSLDGKTLKNASYEKLEKIIKQFCAISFWDLIYDENTVIGAISKNGTSISLEPGCQLEISISPKKEILAIDIELKKIIETLDKIADIYDVIFVGYGITPSANVDEIQLLQKRRYEVMNKYLPIQKFGELSQKMMRQTAGIQINIDYKDSNDAFYKLKFFNLIMPFMMGLCANSSLEKNKLYSKKSLRARVWNYTGKERCNLFYKNIFKGLKNNVFKNYIQEILNVPMIFIERDGKIIEINGKIRFSEFLKTGFRGYFATIEDYILHQSLCFPDIRLKKYIEIRNHDSSNPEMALALATFYKGLAYFDVKKLLSKFKYLKIKNVEKYNEKIIDFGLDYQINNKISGWDVVAKLFIISSSNLTTNERIYLEPILKILKQRKTMSDLVQDKKIKSAKELIEFINKY